MSLNESQLQTINGITPKGVHLNEGAPCECGPQDYITTKERAFSDSMIYHHRCKNCGRSFSTWTEG